MQMKLGGLSPSTAEESIL